MLMKYEKLNLGNNIRNAALLIIQFGSKLQGVDMLWGFNLFYHHQSI